jgi:hypothetical protein
MRAGNSLEVGDDVRGPAIKEKKKKKKEKEKRGRAGLLLLLGQRRVLLTTRGGAVVGRLAGWAGFGPVRFIGRSPFVFLKKNCFLFLGLVFGL